MVWSWKDFSIGTLLDVLARVNFYQLKSDEAKTKKMSPLGLSNTGGTVARWRSSNN